jgi:hypothetical protein
MGGNAGDLRCLVVAEALGTYAHIITREAGHKTL